MPDIDVTEAVRLAAEALAGDVLVGCYCSDCTRQYAAAARLVREAAEVTG